MKILMKLPYYHILKLFYDNHNAPIHLREISRRIKLNESSSTRHLKVLAKNKTLITKKEANLKMFYISKSAISSIYPLFDEERVNSLPLLRRNAILYYLKQLEQKPIALLVFGSTAKGTAQEDSDLDLLEIVYSRKDRKKAKEQVLAQTGIRIQNFQITEIEFRKELKLKQDQLVQSAITTGFPVFNCKYYYEMINNE